MTVESEKVSPPQVFSIRQLFLQFFKFALVGVLNTIIHTGLYWLALFILGMGENNMITAKIISFILSVFIGYAIQKKYVFKGKMELVQLIRVYLAYTLSLVIEIIIMRLGVEYFTAQFGVEHLEIIERFVIFLPMPITIPLNFVMNKIWANKEKWSDS